MDGIFIIDKPKGMTSRDVVNEVEKKLHTKKVGHTGTLDPMATGVLIVCINEGLKIARFLSSEKKTYEVEVCCGIKTDTLDTEGTIEEKNDNYQLEESKICEVLQSFVGSYLQEVPKYSAVKVNGRRLYDYARKNEEVSLPKKMVEIYQISLQKQTKEGFSFSVEVSKGTYIRSLVRDIGEKLSILCTMSGLRRTTQGNFKIKDAITLEQIAWDKILPLKEALNDFPMFSVDLETEQKIKNGALLENKTQQDPIAFLNQKNQVLAIYGIYSKNPSKIKPYHVFSSK